MGLARRRKVGLSLTVAVLASMVVLADPQLAHAEPIMSWGGIWRLEGGEVGDSGVGSVTDVEFTHDTSANTLRATFEKCILTSSAGCSGTLSGSIHGKITSDPSTGKEWVDGTWVNELNFFHLALDDPLRQQTIASQFSFTRESSLGFKNPTFSYMLWYVSITKADGTVTEYPPSTPPAGGGSGTCISGPCREVHVSHLEFPLDERDAHLASVYATSAKEIIKQKNAIELQMRDLDQEISDLTRRSDNLDTEIQSLESKLALPSTALNMVESDHEVFSSTEKACGGGPDRASLRRLVRQKDAKLARIAKIGAPLASIFQWEGDTRRLHRAKLHAAWIDMQLAYEDIQSCLTQISQKSGSPVTGKLLSQYGSALNELKGHLHTYLHKHLARSNVAEDLKPLNRTVRRLQKERAEFDQVLVGIVKRFAAYDFQIERVTVEVDGERVFEAKGNPALFDELTGLEAEIGTLQDILLSLKHERREASQNFQRATREALAAQNDLARSIWITTVAERNVEVLFLAWDLGWAGLRGGPIGIMAELTKKGLESLVIPKIEEQLRSTKPELSPIERKLLDLYGVDLSNGISLEQLAKYFPERELKEGSSKFVRDFLNQKLGSHLEGSLNLELVSLFDDRLRPTEEFARRLGGLDPNDYAELHKKLKRTRRTLEKMRNLGKGYEFSFKSIVRGTFKDVVKSLSQQWIEELGLMSEKKAWLAFLEKDMEARALYPQYSLAKDAYWGAYDALQGLLVEKLGLFELGKAPTAGSFEPVIKSKSFSIEAGTQILISLSTDGAAVSSSELSVYLGGVEASPDPRSSASDLVYRVDVPQSLKPDFTGGLSLRVR